jgi:hypothetical protein
MSGMDIFEVVGLVALCAMSLRIVGSLIAGVVTLAQGSGFYQDEQERIASFLTWVGAFGEVTGIIILLGLVAFLWWRVDRWADIIDEVEDEPDAGSYRQEAQSHLLSLRWECRWLRWLLRVTVVGAVILVVPDFLNLPPIGVQWNQIIVNTVFQIAYVAILVGGIMLSNRLCETCELEMGEQGDLQ